MAIAITSKEDKAETIDFLRKLILRFLFPGVLNLDKREAILNHLLWVQRQKGMFVETRLETVPELAMTKLTLTISHTPQGKVKHDA